MLTTASVAAISMSGGSKKEDAPAISAGTASLAKEQGKSGSRCVFHLYPFLMWVYMRSPWLDELTVLVKRFG